MSKRSLIVAIVATGISLYYFPRHATFWAYTSIAAYVAVCSWLLALFLVSIEIQRAIAYRLLSRRSPKNHVLAVLYASLLVILILFLPIASLLYFSCFAAYVGWEYYKHRQVFFLSKKQHSNEK